jgi:outer membrane lipoprotein-sorting protein
MRRLLPFVLLALAMLLPTAARAAGLSAADQAEVERLRVYLNAITTLEATFQQVDGRGNFATGRFWLHRPNRLRFEYDPPHPVVIVARSSYLIQYDRELREETYLDQKDTPAWFLLRDDVQFGDRIDILRVERSGPLVSITARERGKEDQGAIALIFRQSPLQLVGWRLVDAAGNEVQVTLLDQQRGMAIDPERFELDPRQLDREFQR